MSKEAALSLRRKHINTCWVLNEGWRRSSGSLRLLLALQKAFTLQKQLLFGCATKNTETRIRLPRSIYFAKINVFCTKRITKVQSISERMKVEVERSTLLRNSPVDHSVEDERSSARRHQRRSLQAREALLAAGLAKTIVLF